jgi:hypothetical protein
MPRKLINDYVFYKFVCNDEAIECCYVGSTANFNDRKRGHYNMCNNPNDKRYNYKIYETIRENGGWENWKMVIIGEEKEISLTQSRILEQKYIDELKTNLNMIRAYRTKEDVAECNKKKYEKKKEIYKANARVYYNANKEKQNAKKKEYREANKEKMKAYAKEYMESNIEKIKEKRRLYYLKKKQEKNV